MTILFIAYNFTPYKGGVQRVTNILTQSFIKKGLKVYYLCGCNERDGLSEYTSTQIFYMDKPLHAHFDENSKRIYQQYLRILKVDIIILQYPVFGKSLFFLENALPNVRKVSFLHTMPFSSIGNEKRLMENYYPSNTIKIIQKRIFLKFPFLAKIYYLNKEKNLFRKAIENSDKFGVLSKHFFNDIRNYLPSIDYNKLFSIGNPNTFNNIKTLDLHIKENLILFVGRISNYQKNIIDFLDIWDILSKNNPDWYACIVGDGPDLSLIKSYAADKSIERIYFEGSQKDVSSYYQKAKFVCLTSHNEGWGMVLTEGMSYGCVPIVYGTFGAAYDVVDNNQCGYVTAPYDKKEMVEKIQSLIDSPETFTTFSKKAIIKSQAFNSDKICDKWICLFNSLIQ